MTGGNQVVNGAVEAVYSENLHLAAAFHGLEHGDFVGVFDIAADRNSHGDARDAKALPPELAGEVRSGGFAFDRRIGGEDDFFDFSAGEARQQIGDAELVGADAVQGRERAVKDVIDTVEMTRLFDGGNVCRFLDHTDQFLVARRTGAVFARVNVGNVVADGAEMEIGFDVAYGGGKGFRIVFARTEDVEGEPLRALAADSRQLFEFVDEPGHRLGKFGHKGICNFVIGN